MSYRREDYVKVNELLAERRAKAESEAERRRRAIRAELPEVDAIDRELARTGAKIVGAVGIGESRDRDDIKERIAAVEAENGELHRRRAEALASAGYPADYTEPHYTCMKCRDTGFVGANECECRRRALVLAGYESSGIGELLKKQTFETFSPEYNGGSASVMHAFSAVREYAENFSGEGDGSLLLIGGTGLGKTHLSTAAAGVVIERGFDVKYETAQNMFSDFENWQFHRRDGDEDPTARYFECDLLIVDDLGTEMTNQFTISCLYNLINTRTSRGLGMIFNTNLSQRELRARYDDRITSRLFGEFAALPFEGRDVRAEKLRRR